jgi:uncharacterized protein YcbK (DUF882 family)
MNEKLNLFKCKCCGVNKINETFATKILNLCIAVRLRPEEVITSGYRCDARNKSVGGVKNSSHLTGNAADIKCNNSFERYVIIQESIRLGLCSFGVSDTFIHIDSRPGRQIFLYPIV